MTDAITLEDTFYAQALDAAIRTRNAARPIKLRLQDDHMLSTLPRGGLTASWVPRAFSAWSEFTVTGASYLAGKVILNLTPHWNLSNKEARKFATEISKVRVPLDECDHFESFPEKMDEILNSVDTAAIKKEAEETAAREQRKRWKEMAKDTGNDAFGTW
jgi:hypothetical protein